MLEFSDNTVTEISGERATTWTFEALLAAYDPLADEPSEARHQALRRVAEALAGQYDALPEPTRLHLDFWKNFEPGRVGTRKFKYETTIADTYRWELELDGQGLVYRDVSGQYGTPGKTVFQLPSDFWFYGPAMPLPDFELRKAALDAVRSGFSGRDGLFATAHFKLFGYPRPGPSPLIMEKGNPIARSFVIVRDYGIEYGSENWHDGLTGLGFLSFEQFLSRPGHLDRVLTAEVRQAIYEYLSEPVRTEAVTNVAPSGKTESKRLFLAHRGNVESIQQESETYAATPAEEAVWREELAASNIDLLGKQHDPARLKEVVKTLAEAGVQDIPELLCAAAERANPVQKQAIAQVLWDEFRHEGCVPILLSLLDPSDSYWVTYVFNNLFRKSGSPAVRQWLLRCLEGDDELYFRKSVDVLCMWGMLGDQAFQDRALLLRLNWNARMAGDPSFAEALRETIRLLTD